MRVKHKKAKSTFATAPSPPAAAAAAAGPSQSHIDTRELYAEFGIEYSCTFFWCVISIVILAFQTTSSIKLIPLSFLAAKTNEWNGAAAAAMNRWRHSQRKQMMRLFSNANNYEIMAMDVPKKKKNGIKMNHRRMHKIHTNAQCCSPFFRRMVC